MKKVVFCALLFGLLASCAQNKEKREEFKEDYSAEERRNAGVDSAATASEANVPTTDSLTKKDSAKLSH